MATNPERNVDGILTQLRDYLNVREQQAVRINPRVAAIIDDIVWAQVENLRQLLGKLKSFGPEKFKIADILVGDDEAKRKLLLSMSDNNSLAHGIIDRDEQGQKRVAELAIHDMRTLFRSIDPSLENIIQLIQHWLLWDLPDAADVFHFEEQMRRLDTLLTRGISDDLRSRYRAAMRKAADAPLEDREILATEYKRLDVVLQRIAVRRSEEEAYQMIIRRDETPDGGANREILKIASHLEALRDLGGTDDGPPGDETLAMYARVFDCDPTHVSAQRVADYERGCIAEGKQNLRALLADDRSLGDPYDYKKAQHATLRHRAERELARIEDHCGAPLDGITAAALPASGAPPTPASGVPATFTPSPEAAPVPTPPAPMGLPSGFGMGAALGSSALGISVPPLGGTR